MDLMQGYLKYGAEFKVCCPKVVQIGADATSTGGRIRFLIPVVTSLAKDHTVSPTMHHVDQVSS